jgi:two-component system CheB/CheR fusion protein
VLIQHLDPKHESHLSELLMKASKMPVSEVRGETRAEANHVYVIPPRSNLGISDGVLQTTPRPDRGPNMPIDSFFSASGGPGSQALGVVLLEPHPMGRSASRPSGTLVHHLRTGSANREVRRHAA